MTSLCPNAPIIALSSLAVSSGPRVTTSSNALMVASPQCQVSSKAPVCAGLGPAVSLNSTLYERFELNGGSR